MAIDESTLAKRELRKFAALRRYIGDEVFGKWMVKQAAAAAAKVDPVAEKIEAALAGFVGDKSFNLGNHGYTNRRAPGAGMYRVWSPQRTWNHHRVVTVVRPLLKRFRGRA